MSGPLCHWDNASSKEHEGASPIWSIFREFRGELRRSLAKKSPPRLMVREQGMMAVSRVPTAEAS